MWGSAFGLAIVVGAFVAALIAFAFVVGTPILGIPIAIVGIAVIAIVDFRRRSRQAREMHEFRDEAKAEKIEFTERDKDTLVSE